MVEIIDNLPHFLKILAKDGIFNYKHLYILSTNSA